MVLKCLVRSYVQTYARNFRAHVRVNTKKHETGLLASHNKLVVPTVITLVKASTFN